MRYIGLFAIMFVSFGTACTYNDNYYYDGNNNYNPNNNQTTTGVTKVTVTSSGHSAGITAETGVQGNFLESQVGVYRTFDLVRPSVAVFAGDDTLSIDADAPLEIWEVPYEDLQVMISAIQTYYANSSWGNPVLFPNSVNEVRDLELILSLWACSVWVDKPYLAPVQTGPNGCPAGDIPDEIFVQVSNNGRRSWTGYGYTKFYLVFAPK